VGTGFAVIALWPAVFRGDGPRLWAAVVTLVMVVAGLIFPRVLAPVFRVWMAIGEILGWVNTRIMLSVVYYVLIVPVGLMMRLRNKDPMRRRFDRDASTYRISREKRPASHIWRQY
jgi:hypothetical protein